MKRYIPYLVLWIAVTVYSGAWIVMYSTGSPSAQGMVALTSPTVTSEQATPEGIADDSSSQSASAGFFGSDEVRAALIGAVVGGGMSLLAAERSARRATRSMIRIQRAERIADDLATMRSLRSELVSNKFTIERPIEVDDLRFWLPLQHEALGNAVCGKPVSTEISQSIDECRSIVSEYNVVLSTRNEYLANFKEDTTDTVMESFDIEMENISTRAINTFDRTLGKINSYLYDQRPLEDKIEETLDTEAGWK